MAEPRSSPAEPPATSANTATPLRAATGALTTTIACSVPVFLVGGLAVQISQELGFTPAGLGLAVSAYFGTSALASVPAGALVERYGSTSIARTAISMAGLCLLTIAVAARSLWSLIAILALGAAANAMGQLASNTSLSRHIPVRRQGLAFGVKQAAIPVSTLLAGAAVPVVALTVGWRWAFVFAAAGAAAALFVVPAEDNEHRQKATNIGDRATGALVVIGIGAALAAVSANALGTFLVDSAVARGTEPGAAGLALTLGSAVCIVARIIGGWLADRLPDRQIAVIAGMLTVGAAGLVLLSQVSTATLIIGVVLGFGLGWAWPGLLNFAVVRLHPRAPAAATSITQTGVYAGGCVGPLSLGAVAATAGYPTMWTVAGIAMLWAAAAMVLGSRMLQRHETRTAPPT